MKNILLKLGLYLLLPLSIQAQNFLEGITVQSISSNSENPQALNEATQFQWNLVSKGKSQAIHLINLESLYIEIDLNSNKERNIKTIQNLQQFLEHLPNPTALKKLTISAKDQDPLSLPKALERFTQLEYLSLDRIDLELLETVDFEKFYPSKGLKLSSLDKTEQAYVFLDGFYELEEFWVQSTKLEFIPKSDQLKGLRMGFLYINSLNNVSKKYPNLEELSFSTEQNPNKKIRFNATTIAFLAKLKKLDLNLMMNKVAFEEAELFLSYLKNLESLSYYTYQNKIPDGLSKLPKLKRLDYHSKSPNHSEDISNLKELKQLKSLEFYVQGTNIETVEIIESLTQLEDLKIVFLQEIESPIDFSLFNELKKLEYYGKQADLENISKLSKLEKLIFSSHDSLNIECLKTLSQLTDLHLDVKINEVDGIEELKNLEVLDISIQLYKLLDKLTLLPKLKVLYVDVDSTDEEIKIIKEKYPNLSLGFDFRSSRWLWEEKEKRTEKD